MLLKSNMDRFIEEHTKNRKAVALFLKSNMDRFIVSHTKLNQIIINFKIQYG